MTGRAFDLIYVELDSARYYLVHFNACILYDRSTILL